MIDVHTHVIPFVDDGSTSMEASILLIKKAIDDGVTDLICTPHYRKNMFEPKKLDIITNFMKLKEHIKKENLNINLYLGQEIKYDKNSKTRILENELLTVNNLNYVLLEFSYDKDTDISEITYEYSIKGLIPIIAHIERYSYIKNLEQVLEIKNSGALIQVNASAILGKHGMKIKKFVKKLIKNNLVDFVASDIHENREYNLKEAYLYIEKKFGKIIADNIFNNNAIRLIEGNEQEIAS